MSKPDHHITACLTTSIWFFYFFLGVSVLQITQVKKTGQTERQELDNIPTSRCHLLRFSWSDNLYLRVLRMHKNPGGQINNFGSHTYIKHTLTDEPFTLFETAALWTGTYIEMSGISRSELSLHGDQVNSEDGPLVWPGVCTRRLTYISEDTTKKKTKKRI
jgi:hypothetical protein